MYNLEILAKEFFQNYTYRKTGKVYDWSVLSSESKKRWVIEVRQIFTHIISNLNKELPPINEPIHKMNTQWAQGYNSGAMDERVNIRTMLHDMKDDIDSEYEEFLLKAK